MSWDEEAHAPALGEYELKWTLPERRAAAAGAWLRSRLRRDPRYPAGRVTSLYFDTPDWSLLHEKLNSDYLKTKVRVRWYSDDEGRPASTSAFLEVKARIGSRRVKRRRPVAIEPDVLARLALTDRRLTTLVDRARAEECGLPVPLVPAFVLSYRRERFIDPATGSRVAFDRGIHVERAHPMLSTSARAARLESAVVEVKGSRRELPASLRPLAGLGARRGSFSKYAACQQLLAGTSELAETGRLP